MNEGKDIRIGIADGFYLSPVTRDDKAAYMEHFSDPEIARNLLSLPFPFTEADADAWLDQRMRSVHSAMTTFAIRAPSGYLIGGIAVVGGWSAGEHRAEFGYWLAQGYRGRGLMPRVIGAFANYAFHELQVHRLFATPFASNFSSHRALEKAGFQREGTLRHHHRKQGIYLDAVIYGRLFESNGNA